MLKICIWMNIPSHHQKYFFEALNENSKVSLLIRYYDKILLEHRKQQSWVIPPLDTYEKYISSFDEILSEELREYIHIIPTFDNNYGKQLVELTIKNNLKWCHWGEMTGKGFIKKVKYNLKIFNLLYPIINKIRLKKYANYIKNNSLFAFAQGELAKKDLLNLGIPNNKIKFLSYSVLKIENLQRNQIINNFKKNRICFLCVANLIERKGTKYLIGAYDMLTIEQKEKACIVLVGKGEKEQELKEYVKNKNLEDNILFYGPVNSNEINTVYSSADIFVLPTLFDGWGVVLNEAASCGLPIISTINCGAAYHLIEENKNGFRVQTKDAKALSKTMSYYIDNPTMIKEHGEKSKQIFERFTPQKSAERLVEYLKQYDEDNNK